MQPEFWNDKRPAGVPDSLDFAAYRSVVEVFERSCKKFADRPAFSNLGVTLSYAELDRLSAAFAAYLQKQTDLQPGDRIAQLMVIPVVQAQVRMVDELDETRRGSGGFGSTGK